MVNNQLVFDASDFEYLEAGETEEVIVTYTMSDEDGAESISSVTITVTGTNDAPTAVVDSANVDENLSVTLDVLANDIDVDNNHTLTLDSVSSPKGTANISSNQLVFTASATDFDYLGLGQTENVVVTYVMSDEDGAQSTSTATITITGTNDLPTAVADVGAVAESTSITVDVLANDTDLDANHIFTLDNVTADKGSATIDANNQLVFTADSADFEYLAEGQSEVVVVTYEMRDELGESSTSTATITVTGTNGAPIAVADVDLVQEDSSVTVDVLSNDSDLDNNTTLTLDSVSTPKGSATISANQLVFTATDFDHLDEGQTEDVVVTYIISDENGATATSTVTITVTGTNDTPIAVADAETVSENSSVTLDVLTNDIDLDSNHTFTLDYVSSPKGTAEINANQLVFSVSATEFAYLGLGQSEDVIVTYEMSDENGETSTSTATITVTGTNARANCGCRY
ncbi:Ig-like domain-containing protein [Psychromonas sp. KJ10-10]|uniref:Ig-like domain-containing protein n=1 Tax=Psychromonas sp. KJ10-10 TaxID=3391823 RepID=UPI0039B650CA